MRSNTNFESQWILMDVLDIQTPKLISAGEIEYGRASIRHNLDYWARKLILSRLRGVIESGVDYVGTEVTAEHSWQVEIRLIKSPINHAVLAVLAIFVGEGTPIPTPPIIGSLEWEIDPITGKVRSVWDEHMFHIYEIRAQDLEAYPFNGDIDRWANELVHFDDRAGMKLAVDSAIDQRDSRRYIQDYRINTNVDSSDPGVRWLEASGHVLEGSNGESLWLRAITRVKQEEDRAKDHRFAVLKSEVVLASVLRLMNDHLMVAFDAERNILFMPSENWSDYGLAPIRNGALGSHIHPDDIDSFLARAQLVKSIYDEVLRSGSVRLKLQEGGWETFSTSTVRFVTEPATDRYVLCRLEAEEFKS
jgi:hypothetical protein